MGHSLNKDDKEHYLDNERSEATGKLAAFFDGLDIAPDGG